MGKNTSRGQWTTCLNFHPRIDDRIQVWSLIDWSHTRLCNQFGSITIRWTGFMSWYGCSKFGEYVFLLMTLEIGESTGHPIQLRQEHPAFASSRRHSFKIGDEYKTRLIMTVSYFPARFSESHAPRRYQSPRKNWTDRVRIIERSRYQWRRRDSSDEVDFVLTVEQLLEAKSKEAVERSPQPVLLLPITHACFRKMVASL